MFGWKERWAACWGRSTGQGGEGWTPKSPPAQSCGSEARFEPPSLISHLDLSGFVRAPEVTRIQARRGSGDGVSVLVFSPSLHAGTGLHVGGPLLVTTRWGPFKQHDHVSDGAANAQIRQGGP